MVGEKNGHRLTARLHPGHNQCREWVGGSSHKASVGNDLDFARTGGRMGSGQRDADEDSLACGWCFEGGGQGPAYSSDAAG